MDKYKIRPAMQADLDEIMEIYAHARAFMVRTGNPSQWWGGYPPREMLEEDIREGKLYAVTDESGIRGVFYFVIGPDPTYRRIEDGSWRSDTPYGTIHRIASDGSGGIFSAALKFCLTQIGHIRIDTHHNNGPMQHVVEKHGFSRRGVIYVADGSPRIAYDYL